MAQYFSVAKQRERKPYTIECKHDQCNWSCSEIYAYSYVEAVEIASQIHDTNNNHHLKYRSDRKNYCVTCICNAEMYFKANSKRKEVINIAREIHNSKHDHEFVLKSINEF